MIADFSTLFYVSVPKNVPGTGTVVWLPIKPSPPVTNIFIGCGHLVSLFFPFINSNILINTSLKA